jgi:hypothetical protein
MFISAIELSKNKESAVLGANFFVNHPASKGANKVAESNTIMCIRGMEKCEPYSKCTIGGRTNGTAREVTIINPAISGNLLPTKFATNGGFVCYFEGRYACTSCYAKIFFIPKGCTSSAQNS